MYLPYYDTKSEWAFYKFEEVRRKLVKTVCDYDLSSKTYCSLHPSILTVEELEEEKKKEAVADELYHKTISKLMEELREKFYDWRLDFYMSIESYNYVHSGEDDIPIPEPVFPKKKEEHEKEFREMLKVIRRQIREGAFLGSEPVVIPF